MNIKELERLKESLQENIDDTTHWIESGDLPTDNAWYWHIGYRAALKEMLEILKTIGD